MKSLLKAGGPLFFFLIISAGEAVADPVTWKVTVTNNTGMRMMGLQLVFIKTGGTISDPKITMTTIMGGAAAGAGMITGIGDGNMINVSWTNPGLPSGATIMIQFTTQFAGIEFSSGVWTKPPPGGKVNLNKKDVTLQEIPEPTTLLLLVTGLAGAALKSRRSFRRR